MSYTPLELRDWADMIADPEYGYRKPKISDIQDQLHAHADLIEEVAKLKAHAEDLASEIEWLVPMAESDSLEDCSSEALAAYRRDYPRSEK